MAEHSFQEVMRQWVRARKATKCCGEENNMLSVYPLEAYDDTLIANIEEHVMQWAARNPEPVYPTWGEFFVKHGGLAERWENATNPAWEANMAIGMFRAPIPASIAEKLGLEPKEV